MTVPIIESRMLADAGFRHGFTTRAGGVSAPPFDAFDFATARDTVSLLENQRRLADRVGFDPSKLFQTTQVHGAVVLLADGAPGAMLAREADALVAEPGDGRAVAVRVADCVPVLLADPASGRVAAVHAGWRGLVAGVIGAAVTAMRAPRLLAAIGPCIGACCFEVDRAIGATIAGASAPEAVTRETGAAKAYVDLRLAAAAQLRALGLAVADVDPVFEPSTNAGCTRCNADRFYSYRRDGDASGRLVGVIAAKT